MSGGSSMHGLPSYGLFRPGKAETFFKRGNPGTDIVGLDSPKIGAQYPNDSPFSVDEAMTKVVQYALEPCLETTPAAKYAPYTDTINPAQGKYREMVDYTFSVATSAWEDKALVLQQLASFFHSQSPENLCKEAGLVGTLLEALASEVHQAALSRSHAGALQAQHHALDASHGRLQAAYHHLRHQHSDHVREYDALLVTANQWVSGYQQLKAEYEELEEQKEAGEEEARKEQEQADQREEGYRQQLADGAAQKAQLLETLCGWKKRATTLEQMGWQCGAWEFAAAEVARAKSGPPLSIEWPQEPEDKVVSTLTVEEVCHDEVLHSNPSPDDEIREVFDMVEEGDETCPDDLSPEEQNLEAMSDVPTEICFLLVEEARNLAVNEGLPQLAFPDIEPASLSDLLSKATHTRKGAGKSTAARWWIKAREAFKKVQPGAATVTTAQGAPSTSEAAPDTPGSIHTTKPKTVGRKARKALHKLGRLFSKMSK